MKLLDPAPWLMAILGVTALIWSLLAPWSPRHHRLPSATSYVRGSGSDGIHSGLLRSRRARAGCPAGQSSPGS